jgi:glycosyltransferase involved in cell wall biosynthesis
MPVRTLYICYFGLNEPLVQTQVLPYLRELQKDGIEVSLLTFEPHFRKSWTADKLNEVRAQMAAEGIDWHAAAYHKRPSVPATAYDILNGARIIANLIKEKEFDVLHGRTLIGVVMALAGRRLATRRPKVIYDMRGFFAEEYTDAGIWPAGGWLYRTAKAIDNRAIRKADAFVVLTEKARSLLFPESAETHRDGRGRPVEVIPCCIDQARFAAGTWGTLHERLNVGGRTVIAYVGSFGGWYMTDEMLDLFATARRLDPEVFALVLTQRDPAAVKERFKEADYTDDDLLVATVPPDEVPGYLAAADMAISFIKPCYSKRASSPTKIAEYLACGLPVISNRGIGDLDEQLTADGVGVLIDRFDAKAYEAAFSEIQAMGDVQDRCRESARHRFDLVTVGGPRYRWLYKNLLQT